MPLADFFVKNIFAAFSGIEFLNRPSQFNDESSILPFYLVLDSSYSFYMYFYQKCFSCFSPVFSPVFVACHNQTFYVNILREMPTSLFVLNAWCSSILPENMA